MEFKESRNKIKKMSGIPRTFAKKKFGIPLTNLMKKVWNSDVLYRGWFIIIWNSPLRITYFVRTRTHSVVTKNSYIFLTEQRNRMIIFERKTFCDFCHSVYPGLLFVLIFLSKECLFQFNELQGSNR